MQPDDATPRTGATGAPTGRRWLVGGLVAVIAAGLVVIGGALAVGLGIGRTDSPGAGSVDAGFSLDMSHHHLQAVEMANLAAARSSDPEVQSLAFDISQTQLNQVGRMQGWLTLWGLPVTGRNDMSWMGSSMHDHSSGGLMPGMATEDELAQLRAATGEDFDVLFLQLMIRHHQGGLEMAEYGAAHASEAVVRGLARSIVETQTAETGTMATMLAARGGSPLPAP
ncbi:Uncharacterized conserved protein, DUF305 family [Klenkia marina]|uniref:Uncharacterized conserved protein, DUF305 family n=1 Tax=Klenkia marina TaxID=1960309 RepID=A0A1G4YG47_9ACTN|nr:DUF305 domain-containing protein [Klenkia marina]SCX52403.1 Uncharacterized conserved protein, DUF305 family [Klenkia marina]